MTLNKTPAMTDIAAGYLRSDESFNGLYPRPIRDLANYHWTPLEVAVRATRFLAGNEPVRILDIGCGVGKYCLAAACHAPQAKIFGVEQRAHLLRHAVRAQKKLMVRNVQFLHANFTQLELSRYDHFYFFNSFYENLEATERIDDSIDGTVELYDYYNRYLCRQLALMPAGTRLVTFHSLEYEVPPGYYVAESDLENLLKCWIKAG